MDNKTWLFFSFSLPAKNQSGRMRVWRRLTSLGAVIIKSAFYALPAREDLKEQLTWLAKEVEELGGEALFLETSPPTNMSGTEIAGLLTRAREEDWQALEMEILPLLDEARTASPDKTALEGSRRRFSKRAEAIRSIDYFPTERGPRVEALLTELGILLSPAAIATKPGLPAQSPELYTGMIWVTRERPYIDRLASFWLVRRYLDPGAEIAFVPGGAKTPKQDGQVRFDMAEAEFTHVGSLTTFEVLCESFRLATRIPARFREVIRAIDLDGLETGPLEAVGLKRILNGMLSAVPDDKKLVEQSLALFDALLASYTAT